MPPQGVTGAAVVVVLLEVGKLVDAELLVLVELSSVALVVLPVVAVIELPPGALVETETVVLVELTVVALVGVRTVVVVVLVVVVPGMGTWLPTSSLTHPFTIASIVCASPVVAQPPFTCAFASAAPKRTSARARHAASTARFLAIAF
jgi:hypothetical protein